MAFEIENLAAAFFVISLWSILFKETLLFRFAQRTYVGVSIGVTIATTLTTITNTAWTPLTKGDYSPTLAIILGIMMLARLVRRYDWLSRYPVAFITGTGLALMTRTAMQAQIIGQILPVITVKWITGDIYTTLGNIYSVVGLIGGITFFIFATERLPARAKRSLEYLRQIGRYALVMMLGTYFANIVIGRSSNMLERLLFLLQTFGIVR